MTSVNDGVMLMLVAMLNFFGAILLAHYRARRDVLALPASEMPKTHAQPEAVSG